MSIGLYCAFLAIQTGRHRRYFMLEEEAGMTSRHTAEGSRALALARQRC